MYLVKATNGTYSPAYNSDYCQSQKIKVGDEVYAVRQRNIKFHRKAFALLQLGFDNQDVYKDKSIYRQVVTMKAGFVNWVQGADGKEHPLPQSISFENMNSEKFEEWYLAVKEVVSKQVGVDIEDEIENYF